jgi:UDP-N-acetylglucosamine 2-epimerase
LKPGWIRVSIHPTTTTEELLTLCDGLIALAENYKEWEFDYTLVNGKFYHKKEISNPTPSLSEGWFEF